MPVNVTHAVLPPLSPASTVLHFFCALDGGPDAARDLLATLAVWARMDALTPHEVSMHIACGVRCDADWYDLASRWFLQEKQGLSSPAALAATWSQVRGVLEKMGRAGEELNTFLAANLAETQHVARTQAISVH